MPELRWNPLLNTWTMIATNRQARPHLPKDWNPFAAGQGKIPASYDVLAYDNDFPVLQLLDEPIPGITISPEHPIFKSAPAYGKCEVILYTSDATKELYDLSDAHVLKLVELWTERFRELSRDERIKYIFEFENRGEEVGVTVHHPHGQLYAYSWLPAKIETELTNCKNHYEQKGTNLFDDLNEAEKAHGQRVIMEGKNFIAYIPYFTDYPFGVFVVSKNLKQNFTEFTQEEKEELAVTLKQLTRAFDSLYERKFPYMMCIHQSPVNCLEHKDTSAYYAFHIEFYPPLRARDKVKYYAGSEMGAGAAANPLDVDECAELLRNKL